MRLLLRGLRLEAKTEAGRVNALLIGVCALFLLVAGAPNLIEQVISLWVDDYQASFPVVETLAIVMGGGLVCVLMLVILEPLLQARDQRAKRVDAAIVELLRRLR